MVEQAEAILVFLIITIQYYAKLIPRFVSALERLIQMELGEPGISSVLASPAFQHFVRLKRF